MNSSQKKPAKRYNPYLAAGMIDVDSPYLISHWQELEDPELSPLPKTSQEGKDYPHSVGIQIRFFPKK